MSNGPIYLWQLIYQAKTQPDVKPTISAPTNVIFDAISVPILTTSVSGPQTSFSDSTGLTIANNANRALLVEVCFAGTPTGISLTWNGVPLTLLASQADSGTTILTQLYGL